MITQFLKCIHALLRLVYYRCIEDRLLIVYMQSDKSNTNLSFINTTHIMVIKNYILTNGSVYIQKLDVCSFSFVNHTTMILLFFD
jgi:hypothetical protein